MIGKPTFYLKKPGGRGETLIYLFFFFDRQRLKLSTGLSIAPMHWSFTRQRVKRGVLFEVAINDQLDWMAETVMNIYAELRRAGTTPTPQLIRERLYPADTNESVTQIDVLACFEDFIERSRTRVQQGTIKNYKVTKEHLRKFAEAYQIELSFEEMDSMFFERFTGYLLNIVERNNNGAWNMIKNLKVFVKDARERGLHTSSQYEQFTIKKYDPPVVALSQEELDSLHGLNLSGNPRLAHVRDLFLLQCYTSLRYSDLQSLKPAHIQGDAIRIVTQKTSEPITIPLLPETREILGRYPDMQIRVLSNQKMNKYLKELAQSAGIDTPCSTIEYRSTQRIEHTFPKYELIGTHTGRRTFVTLSLERGMRPEAVMKITGHKDMKSFQRYIGVTNVVAARELRSAWSRPETQSSP